MGDVAMTVPVLKALTEQNPNLKITVVTRGAFASLFKIVPGVDVIKADLKGEHKGILGLWNLSKEINKLGIDAVADLHNVLRTHILKAFIRTRPFVRIDKGRKEKKALVSGSDFKQLKSTHQRYCDVFEKLNLKADLKDPNFPSKSNLKDHQKSLIGEYNSLIGIAPFAAFKGKVYPLEQMKTVIDELATTGKVILFGGGEKETQILDGLSEANENIINMAGKVSFEDELDIISNLDVMVSMDSGNAHLAAMMGVNVVTLWGVTHPYAGFYPFNQDPNNALLADRSIYPKIPTSIYGNKQPEGYENAMNSIDPQLVVKKVISVINRS